jgi:hypothetical protein
MGSLEMTDDLTGGRTILTATVRVPPTVVFRRFVRETVVLNLANGKYHGLNPIAGRMLEVLLDVGRVGDAAKRLAVEFNVDLTDIQTDLAEFCRDLLSRGLIEIDAK